MVGLIDGLMVGLIDGLTACPDSEGDGLDGLKMSKTA